MNKTSFHPERFLLVALLLFIGCASGKNYSSTPDECFNTNRNKQIENGFELIYEAYAHIVTEYYKPVSVSAMLTESVKGIESLVGDTGFFIVEDDQPKIIHPFTDKSLGEEELDLKVTLYEGLGILEEIYRVTVENKSYYSPESIAYAALDGLVQVLDSPSRLWPPDATGVGIQPYIKDGFVTVIATTDDSSAQKAGIMAGDKIISIDGKPVTNLRQTLSMLLGAKGTKVMVSVARAGKNEPLDFLMIRDDSRSVNIRAIPLAPGYGYVRLSGFPKGTSSQLEKILNELETWADPLQGLVLDLRNNSGGLLSEAILVSDLFLEKGKIVTLDQPRLRKKLYMATPNAMDRRYSMIVLINEGSAAASEIVAGALQDNKDAFILGTKSFGTGSVQTMETLSCGYTFKITIAFCYTPNGRSIQDEAIEPDIVVKRNFVSDNDYFYIDHPLLTKDGPENPLSIKRKIEADNQVKRALEFLIQNNQLKIDA